MVSTVHLDVATAPSGTDVNITSGTPASTTSIGTAVNITAGDGGATSGNGGSVNISPGVNTGIGAIGFVVLTNIPEFSNDGTAAAGGVPLGGLYHNNSDLRIRIT